MMENWGVPSILLHAKAYVICEHPGPEIKKVVDLACGGGIAGRPDV
jgi:hypothetical protein